MFGLLCCPSGSIDASRPPWFAPPSHNHIEVCYDPSGGHWAATSLAYHSGGLGLQELFVSFTNVKKN